MGLVSGLWLIVLGVLAVPSLIIAKKPNAKELIDKLTPYQGWIGAISAIYGIYGIIFQGILGMSWMSTWFIYWVTLLANNVLLLALGLLLGVGVLKTFIKDPTAQAKMDQTIAKLAPKQGVLGLAAIGVGIWMIISGFLFH